MNKARQKQSAPDPDVLVQLLEAVALRQDREAFSQLFAHFAPRVKMFLLRTGLTDEVAEDVTQEVMIILWQKASYFDRSRAGVSTWVFTIARNRKIDRLRRLKTRPSQFVFDPSDEPNAPLSGDSAIITAEREDGVRKALAALPTEQAAIIKLSFFSEKPHAEIAKELGIPLGTVKSRVRLALNRLRTLLDENL